MFILVKAKRIVLRKDFYHIIFREKNLFKELSFVNPDWAESIALSILNARRKSKLKAQVTRGQLKSSDNYSTHAILIDKNIGTRDKALKIAEKIQDKVDRENENQQKIGIRTSITPTPQQREKERQELKDVQRQQDSINKAREINLRNSPEWKLGNFRIRGFGKFPIKKGKQHQYYGYIYLGNTFVKSFWFSSPTDNQMKVILKEQIKDITGIEIK